MRSQIKALTGSVILASLLLLTACNSDNSNAATNAPTLAPTLTATPAPSLAPSPTATAAPAAPAAVTPAPATPKATASTDVDSKLIKELMTLAKAGKIPDVKFGAHTGLIDDVEKAWGKADKQEPAGKGFYATYDARKVVFGFNKGQQIFDVRSSDASLQKLTLKEIEHVLAKPDDITVNGDDSIYVYKVNDQYQLKFVIPKSTGKVDHISVFAPQDSINNMAG
jgi:hypothetical protein